MVAFVAFYSLVRAASPVPVAEIIATALMNSSIQSV